MIVPRFDWLGEEIKRPRIDLRECGLFIAEDVWPRAWQTRFRVKWRHRNAVTAMSLAIHGFMSGPNPLSPFIPWADDADLPRLCRRIERFCRRVIRWPHLHRVVIETAIHQPKSLVMPALMHACDYDPRRVDAILHRNARGTNVLLERLEKRLGVHPPEDSELDCLFFADLAAVADASVYISSDGRPRIRTGRRAHVIAAALTLGLFNNENVMAPWMRDSGRYGQFRIARHALRWIEARTSGIWKRTGLHADLTARTSGWHRIRTTAGTLEVASALHHDAYPTGIATAWIFRHVPSEFEYVARGTHTRDSLRRCMPRVLDAFRAHLERQKS